MKAIPQEAIEQVPDQVTPDRESCEHAVDRALLVLFMIGAQSTVQLTFPPIVSGGGNEVWKLPMPWTSGEESSRQLIENLNGDPDKNQTGLLTHVKTNAEAFNAALASGAIPEAERIIAITPGDSTQVWNDCNSLACNIEDEDVYRPLELEDETKRAYYLAAGIAG